MELAEGLSSSRVLDAFGVLSVSTIGFLSGCTVLVMSCYSVVRSRVSHSSSIDMAVGTPLAVGAAVGGVAGKSLFQWVESLFPDPNTAGAVQAITLGVITLGTLIYTVKKDKIHTYHIKSKLVCLIIGFVLGIMSSFLGIGGGPINLVVLYFFFSMTTRWPPKILSILYCFLRQQVFCRHCSPGCLSFPGFFFWECSRRTTGGNVWKSDQ